MAAALEGVVASGRTREGSIPATAASFAPPASGHQGLYDMWADNVTCRIDDPGRHCSSRQKMLGNLAFIRHYCGLCRSCYAFISIFSFVELEKPAGLPHSLTLADFLSEVGVRWQGRSSDVDHLDGST